jgi:glycosyltransferase 2 family protein
LKTTPITKTSLHGQSPNKQFLVKGKRYLSVLLFTSLGILILWYITRNQDMSKIWNEFQNAKLIWIFLAFLCGIIANYFRAIRWNLLIGPLGETPKTSTTFYAQMTGYMTNLAVPRLGELTRCATLAKYSKIPFNALAGTVVAERVFDMISLMVLIFLTVLFQFAFLKEFLDGYIFTPFIGLLNGNIWYLIIIFLITVMIGFFILKYIKGIKTENEGISGKIKRQIIGFLKGVISLTSIQNKMWFLILSILIWTFYFLTVYLCFFALPGTSFLGVADGFTILVMGSLGVVAPVPGGVGTYHFIVITTLTELLGVAKESATSYAYISHATQMVTVLILGGVSWLMLSLKIKAEKSKA